MEDLAYLYPDVPPSEAAGALLDAGPRRSSSSPTALVRPWLSCPDSVLAEEAPSVTVVDTIGAGDAFGGGFLAWWTAHGLGRADLPRAGLVGQALRAAAGGRGPRPVPARARTRPTLAEMQARDWWP